MTYAVRYYYSLISGVASDVEGTFSATINWNTVSDKSIVIPAIDTCSVSEAWTKYCLH